MQLNSWLIFSEYTCSLTKIINNLENEANPAIGLNAGPNSTLIELQSLLF